MAKANGVTLISIEFINSMGYQIINMLINYCNINYDVNDALVMSSE